MTARKFAISLPEELFERLEQDRQERKLNRLARDQAVAVRGAVTLVPVTGRVRGIPVEVALGPEDGLPRACVANADNIATVLKTHLLRRIGRLSPEKLRAVEDAVRFALSL
jgi:mRNA-degrading endonuclease toxin of MazEF toxin-antitoxin module